MIYRVLDPALPFLGVHITRTSDGDVLLGPTALPVASRTAYALTSFDPRDAAQTLMWPGSWRVARRFWRTGLGEVRMAASRRAFVAACTDYKPSMSMSMSMSIDDLDGSTMAGVRAQAIGPPSPAAPSASALAAQIVGRLEPRG